MHPTYKRPPLYTIKKKLHDHADSSQDEILKNTKAFECFWSLMDWKSLLKWWKRKMWQNKEHFPGHTVLFIKHSGGSLMVWVCNAASGHVAANRSKKINAEVQKHSLVGKRCSITKKTDELLRVKIGWFRNLISIWLSYILLAKDQTDSRELQRRPASASSWKIPCAVSMVWTLFQLVLSTGSTPLDSTTVLYVTLCLYIYISKVRSL